MKLSVLLIFTIVFGTIAYALEPVPINRWVTNAYHTVTGTAVQEAQKLPTLIPVVRSATIGGHTFRVEVADSDVLRYRGLSGRASLQEDHGMLFTFPSPNRYGFTMRGMRFALDFVWVEGGEVTGVTENVPAPLANEEPRLVNPPGLVDSVFEFAAGTVHRTGITPGAAVLVGS